MSLASQLHRQRKAKCGVGLPEQHKSRSGWVSKSVKSRHRESERDVRSTDSYVALQKLPPRWVETSMAESSEDDVVIAVEKD